MKKNKKILTLTESQIINLLSNLNNKTFLKENDQQLNIAPAIQPMDVKNVNQLIIYLKNVIKTLNNPEIKNKVKFSPNETQSIASFLNSLINTAAQPENVGGKLKNFLKKTASTFGITEGKSNKVVIKLSEAEFYDLINEAITYHT